MRLQTAHQLLEDEDESDVENSKSARQRQLSERATRIRELRSALARNDAHKVAITRVAAAAHEEIERLNQRHRSSQAQLRLMRSEIEDAENRAIEYADAAKRREAHIVAVVEQRSEERARAALDNFRMRLASFESTISERDKAQMRHVERLEALLDRVDRELNAIGPPVATQLRPLLKQIRGCASTLRASQAKATPVETGKENSTNIASSRQDTVRPKRPSAGTASRPPSAMRPTRPLIPQSVPSGGSLKRETDIRKRTLGNNGHTSVAEIRRLEDELRAAREKTKSAEADASSARKSAERAEAALRQSRRQQMAQRNAASLAASATKEAVKDAVALVERESKERIALQRKLATSEEMGGKLAEALASAENDRDGDWQAHMQFIDGTAANIDSFESIIQEQEEHLYAERRSAAQHADLLSARISNVTQALQDESIPDTSSELRQIDRDMASLDRSIEGAAVNLKELNTRSGETLSGAGPCRQQ